MFHFRLLSCLAIGLFLCASAALALVDDFNDGNDDGWSPIQGEWEVRDGVYHQADPAWSTTSTNETYQRTFLGDVNLPERGTARHC